MNKFTITCFEELETAYGFSIKVEIVLETLAKNALQARKKALSDPAKYLAYASVLGRPLDANSVEVQEFVACMEPHSVKVEDYY